MFDIIFLPDIQDLWLYSFFVEKYRNSNVELKIMVQLNKKISSVDRHVDFFKKLPFASSTSISFVNKATVASLVLIDILERSQLRAAES